MRYTAGKLTDRLQLLGLAKTLFRIASPRDVQLRGEKVDQLVVGIERRRNEKRIPERCAVLLVVDQLDRGFLPLLDSAPYLGDCVAIGFRTLKQSAIGAD